MGIGKDEVTTQLDIFTSLASETLEFYERVRGDIAHESARTVLGAHLTEQRRLLDDLEEIRRARGGLPQEGDPERAQLRALYVRMAALPASGDARILESVTEAAAALRARAEETLGYGLPESLSRPLAAIQSDCDSLIESLRDCLSG
jgi:hypothetical protein